MNRTDSSVFRILLAGYVNINVIDGSAFFLSGFAGMCAQHPYVHVDLVTANPVTTWEVLDELAEFQNVTILDPYSSQAGRLELAGKQYMSRRDYASVVSDTFQNGEYDAVLIRDNEVAREFIKNTADARHRTYAYVTGLAFINDAQDLEQLEMLDDIVRFGGKLVCQTEEIRDIVRSSTRAEEENITLLPPHVPDPEPYALQTLENMVAPSRLIYTGKFFKDWNADLLLASFKAANLDGAELHLDVAGDQFRDSLEDPYFTANVRYLLTSPGVEWHGRVPRNVSRSLISRSHVGIGWRSGRLDTSTELSTKILEYGALGRPAIINRTPMHERLLGQDYPLFANSISEFRHILQNLRTMKQDVLDAAARCHAVSQTHSYSEIGVRVLPELGNAPDGEASFSQVISSTLPEEISERFKKRRARVKVRGIWAEFFLDESSESTVGQLANELANDYKSTQRAVAITRKRIEVLSKQENMQKFAKPKLTAEKGDPTPEGADELAEALEGAQKIADRLENELQEVDIELEKSKRREAYWRDHSKKQTAHLEALRNSRLGRIQRALWRLRG